MEVAKANVVDGIYKCLRKIYVQNELDFKVGGYWSEEEPEAQKKKSK